MRNIFECFRRRNRSFLPLVGLGILLVLYTFVLLTYFVPVTGGVDQNGYHVCARMFNLDGVFYQKPIDDLQFIGSMWVVNDRGEYYPKYPPFYPALAAGMNAMFGAGGGFYATLWGAVFAVGGMFVLARFWVGRYYALLAAAMMALSPVVATLGITKNSHTPSLAFLVWGMAAFLFGAVRRRHWWSIFFAAAGGVLVGFTVGIRYTDFLMIAVPLAYGFFVVRGGGKWRLLAALCCGAAIPYALLAYFHLQAYGAPWRSGYSLTSESSAFAVRFMFQNLLIYLPEFFMLVVGPLGVLALVVWRLRWRRGLFWSAWLVPTFALYLAYYWAPEGENTGAMRFLIPLVPAVIILSILSLRRLFGKFGSRKAAVLSLVLLLALQGIWGWTRITRMGEPKAAGDLQKGVLVESVKQRIPAGAAIVAGSGLLDELDFERRWTLYPSYLLNQKEISRVVERSLGAQAAGLQQQRAQALKSAVGGFNHNELYGYLRDFFDRKQQAGQEVYFLGRPGEANSFKRIFYRQYEVESLGLITGNRPAWLLRDVKPDASRYRPREEPVALTAYEIVRLGPKRTVPLPMLDSAALLQSERAALFSRIDPQNDPELRRDLERLESICNEVIGLRRAIADAKIRAGQVQAARLEKERAGQLRAAQSAAEKLRQENGKLREELKALRSRPAAKKRPEPAAGKANAD